MVKVSVLAALLLVGESQAIHLNSRHRGPADKNLQADDNDWKDTLASISGEPLDQSSFDPKIVQVGVKAPEPKPVQQQQAQKEEPAKNETKPQAVVEEVQPVDVRPIWEGKAHSQVEVLSDYSSFMESKQKEFEEKLPEIKKYENPLPAAPALSQPTKNKSSSAQVGDAPKKNGTKASLSQPTNATAPALNQQQTSQLESSAMADYASEHTPQNLQQPPNATQAFPSIKLEHSTNDQEEDTAIKEIALKVMTEQEKDSKLENEIKAEESHQEKINVNKEIALLKSGEFDKVMFKENEEEEETAEPQQMSVTEAYRKGQ